jgi:hypothetical protein
MMLRPCYKQIQAYRPGILGTQAKLWHRIDDLSAVAHRLDQDVFKGSGLGGLG